MKKLLIILALFFSFGQTTFAQDYVETRVNTKLPWMDCPPEEENAEKNEDGTAKTPVYKCKVPRGTNGVTTMLGGMIKYATFIVGLLGVMFIVYSGIMYSMGGANDGLKSAAKERVVKTIIGLVILLLSGYILQFIAPWVYK